VFGSLFLKKGKKERKQACYLKNEESSTCFLKKEERKPVLLKMRSKPVPLK
jgi:hypothetical protein